MELRTSKRICTEKVGTQPPPQLVFRLPTPVSLSPPSSTHVPAKPPKVVSQRALLANAEHDSWQSRLSSPLPPRDVYHLDPTSLSAYAGACESVPPLSPRLDHLLEVEATSIVAREEWLGRNKNFDIGHALFDLFRTCITKSSDEPNETAFVATCILRRLAGKKRILTSAQKESYALGALLLASKICEENDPKVCDLIKYANYQVTVDQVLAAERRLALELEWSFPFASPTEIGYAMLDCLCVDGCGLRPNVKMAIMAAAEPVIYDWLFDEPDYRPSLLVAAVLAAVFVYIFKSKQQWLIYFASLIEHHHSSHPSNDNDSDKHFESVVEKLAGIYSQIRESVEAEINGLLGKQ